MSSRNLVAGLVLSFAFVAAHAQAPAGAPRASSGPPGLVDSGSRSTAFVVKFKVKDGKNAEFEKIFRRMEIQVRRNEPGNIYYNLYVTAKDPQTYVIIEQYRNQAAVAAHGKDAGHLMADLRSLLDGPPQFEQLLRVSSK
ncbi:MAG TPA: putative quinol monooxygenase [Steroidobacteraceae bacterium]|nr:putative quinol monooxygenase [Steroidobacteraceae bacterium]